MAKVITDDKHYADIAAVMRKNGPYFQDTFRPAEMAEKLQHMANFQESNGYNRGYADAKANGGDIDAAYDEGYTAGKQAEYDRFWDSYQQNGIRTNYDSAFRGDGWNSNTFYPKYNITVSSPNNCFTNFAGNISLTERLAACGVVLDLTKSGSLVQFFMGSRITEIPPLNAPLCNNIGYVCGSCYNLTNFELTTEKELTSTNGAFNNCTSLVDVSLNCVIATSVNFQWSPLRKASLESVIAALSTTATGQTASFRKTAVDRAFETAEAAVDGSTSEEWLSLVATRENWTISLV